MKNENINLASSECQNRRILEYLQKGHRITQRDAYRLFNCSRLASRISDLKNQFMIDGIDSRFIKTTSGKHVKEYFIK